MSLPDCLDFTDKTVLVSGGSDGIGYGIAKAFHTTGANVIITGTRAADHYTQDFGGLSFQQLDVRDADAIDELSKATPTLHVLINCVGTVLYKKQEFERQKFAKIIDINLNGIMHLCTAFHDQLAASQGNIINLDSVAARIPAFNNPAYSASKAALVQLSKTLAVQWGRHGIRVNGIGPGIVPTKLTSNQVNAEAEAAFTKTCPLGRFGSPQDMAGVALFLASPLAAYVTGQSIVVDGGLSLRGAF